jgi:hypothetical protein
MALRDMHGELEATLRAAAAALQQGNVPFILGGSMASWARGGPLSRKDIDVYVKAEDAERALELLTGAGMQTERPPEQWLFKAWSGEVLVDLIFDPLDGPITDERIAAAEWMPVLALWMRVAPLEDVLVGRLLALPEQQLDFTGLVEIARALRERIDWTEVRARTDGSPCANAYFALLESAGVIAAPETPYRDAASHARVSWPLRHQPAARPPAASSGDAARDRARGRGAFDRFAERVSDLASGATFFAISAALVILWLPTIVVFRSVDTWQLVINTATSVLAFLLVALLQNSERRTDRAASRKLDALAAAVAELLDAQVSGGDPQAQVRRARELREAIRLEEDI